MLIIFKVLKATSCMLFCLILLPFFTVTHAFDYKNQPESFWKQHLSAEQYHICRERGTERAYSSKLHDATSEGRYACACCGGDYILYTSKNKYDSKTGWPSFWQAANKDSVNYQPDKRFINRLYGANTEVICGRCGAHLGHIFKDGPTDKTGLRHCINGEALKFIPAGEKPVAKFP